MSRIHILQKTGFWIEKILQNREILKDLVSNQDGKTIAGKALFYKGFGRFSRCKFRFALLVFEPLTPMYFIKIFRSIKIVCGYTKKSPPI